MCDRSGDLCSAVLRGLSRSFLKPPAPCHSFTPAEGCGTERRDFSISPWGNMLLPPLWVSVLAALAAAVQCSSPPSNQKWGELGTGESCKVMAITLGLCWGHQYNLLSVVLVLWLGMALITWELKHSARSIGDPEEVGIPRITVYTQKDGVAIIKYWK